MRIPHRFFNVGALIKVLSDRTQPGHSEPSSSMVTGLTSHPCRPHEGVESA